MKPSSFQIRIELTLLLAFFAASCVHSTAPNFSEPRLDKATDNTAQAADPEATEPAMIIHIDPKTGEIIAPQDALLPGTVPQPPVDAAKKAPPELRENLSPVPGGGVVIQLDERFMTPLTATVDAEGKLCIEHQSGMSGADDKK